MQAAATAMIESYCDEVNTALKGPLRKRDSICGPGSVRIRRFSIGMPEDITAVLETAKRIGIMLTDSF